MNHIASICISAREKSEFIHISGLIKEMSPDTRIYTFEEVIQNNDLLDEIDFIFTVGGDGTVAWLIKTFFEQIGSIKKIKPIIPIIRPTSIGYLMQLKYETEEFKLGYQKILQGKYSIQNRTVLKTKLYDKYHIAVNEIYIACTPHLGKFKLSLEEKNKFDLGNPITTTMADGIILSTSIGSTGWSLSHNGLISLDEDSLQVVFVGGIHSSANFLIPRKRFVLDLELKNSSITDDTVDAYLNSRKEMGYTTDTAPQETLNIIFGSRIIIDGKIVAFGINVIEVDPCESVPFVYLQYETNIDKARKLTKQPDVTETQYF
jgi:NAD kinase